MNELASAQAAVAALRPVLTDITSDQLSLPTPCQGFDVAGLADHLVGTITMARESAEADLTARFGEKRSSKSARLDGETEDSVLARVTSAAESGAVT